jgi:hypothetical protein
VSIYFITTIHIVAGRSDTERTIRRTLGDLVSPFPDGSGKIEVHSWRYPVTGLIAKASAKCPETLLVASELADVRPDGIVIFGFIGGELVFRLVDNVEPGYAYHDEGPIREIFKKRAAVRAATFSGFTFYPQKRAEVVS